MVMDEIWKKNQQALGLTDEQLEVMKQDPKRRKFIEASPQLVRKKVIAEVISAKNCAAGHKVGDRYVIRAAGYLVPEESPKNLCLSALVPLQPFVSVAGERIAEGIDPNGMITDHAGCLDVGFECGGFGRVVMKIRVE